MKLKQLFAVGLVALTAVASVQASEAAAPKESAALALSTDEQAFAAKLNAENRKTFCNKFTSEQRKSAMVAFTNKSAHPISADEAVQKIAGGTVAAETKEAAAVANAEKAPAAPQVK